MKMEFLVAIGAYLALSSPDAAEELKDPRTRDIDISLTEISVGVNRLASGFYEYIYSLSAPLENKGTVTEFNVDIACDEMPDGEYVFPEPPINLRWDYWGNGKHPPVQIYPSVTGSSSLAIGRKNNVIFGVLSEPGESHTGFRILSPFPPADRAYQLRPHWTTGDYDYSNLTDEEWDALSIRDDFWVDGMTRGPGCSPEPAPPALFRGTGDHVSEDLLQYASPMISFFHTSDSTVAIEIYYGDALAPESFKVQPGWARKYFNPEPGTNESVTLKLHPGENRFNLYAEPTDAQPANPRLLKKFDSDNFYIRRDVPAAERGGQHPPVAPGKNR